VGDGETAWRAGLHCLLQLKVGIAGVDHGVFSKPGVVGVIRLLAAIITLTLISVKAQ
tara:strand:+ start:373 stop:543 length:171 start_codon:yes stop_codon:yes gene_type:complete